jgi:ATP-dependent Clp protease ATP-binding subunit ClpA
MLSQSRRIFWRLRRFFGWFDHRFSDDLRWLMAKAHRFAVTSGSSTVTTSHVLAAIAMHPTGRALLGSHAERILSEASGKAEQPTPIPPKGRLPLQPDVKRLVQESLIAMKAGGWERIEVEHFFAVLVALQDSSAAPLLRKFGLMPPGGSAAE